MNLRSGLATGAFGVAALAALAVSHGAPQQPACLYGAQGALPDRVCTPGAIDPRVTQANLTETICPSSHDGYGSKTRPPVELTNAIKYQSMVAYGVAKDEPDAKRQAAGYENDHLLSLELGGAAADPRNLWPESYAGVYGARTKDKVENATHKAVCEGRITLADAQRGIAGNWIGLGTTLGVLP